MSISGGLDLLAEVIGRAEPVRQRQVLDRLEAIGRSGGIRIEQASAAPHGGLSASRFSDLMSADDKSAPGVRTNFNLAQHSEASGASQAAGEFEKFFLSQFLQSILPASGGDSKQGSDVLVQDMARSQMANALAGDLSKQLELGIAEQVAAARPELQPRTGSYLLPPDITVPASAPSHPDLARVETPVSGFTVSTDDKRPGPAAMRMQESDVVGGPANRPVSAESTSPVSVLLSAIEGFFESIGGSGSATERLRSLR
jgi:hypothetical protein